MIVGCVREIKKHEYRVGMTPENAAEYVKRGHSVFIEKGAGAGSGFSDGEYEAAGAQILDDAAKVWAACGMIVKVKEPLPEEYPLMRKNQILYAYLHLAADRALTDALLKSGCAAVAYETIEDGEGGLPLLRPMSEIAGRLSVQEGAKYLEKPFGGEGVLLSGVPGVRSARVVVLGGGVVGTNACKMAVGLGADVTVVDINANRLRKLDDMFGNKIKTVYSTGPAIRKEVSDADLVIGAVLIPGDSAPKLLKKEYLKLMRPGCVIVDVAVDQGGCFETTKATYHDDPVYTVEGVVHYCVANMPGSVPKTSTLALNNATLSYGLKLAEMGVEKAAASDGGLLRGLNVYKGRCVYDKVASRFGLECAKLAL